MLFVLRKEVDGETKYQVVECENHHQAMNQDMLDLYIDENGKTKIRPEGEEVAYTGIFDVGSTNLIEEIDEIHKVHQFYYRKLKEIGIDSHTFEPLKK